MKKNVFFILLFFIGSFVFADEIINLLDKAKLQYNNNDTEECIKTIDSLKEKLKNKETNNSNNVVEVSFNRLKVTPEKFDNKALKIRSVAISSTGFKKLSYYNKNNEYGVIVSNITQNDFFQAYLDEGKLIFVMNDTLVDKLLDIIPAGYSYYFNIWTEPIQKYSYYLTDYSPERICYIAKIIKLESIEYNKYTEQSFDTSEFIEE